MFSSLKGMFFGGLGLLLVLAIVVYAAHSIGYNKGKTISEVEIADYERRIAEANARELQKEIIIRERVIREYHTREIERTRVQVINRDVIQEAVPEQHQLSQGWVYAHDQSAKGGEIDPAVASDPTPSETSDREALVIVNDNYDIARGNKSKLDALQQYIKDTQRDDPQVLDSDSSEPSTR